MTIESLTTLRGLLLYPYMRQSADFYSTTIKWIRSKSNQVTTLVLVWIYSSCSMEFLCHSEVTACEINNSARKGCHTKLGAGLSIVRNLSLSLCSSKSLSMSMSVCVELFLCKSSLSNAANHSSLLPFAINLCLCLLSFLVCVHFHFKSEEFLQKHPEALLWILWRQ